MDVYQTFQDFASNLIVQNQSSIENRFGLITQRLNRDFRDIESKVDNGIYVGSYGRDTAINGVSDLDLLFVLPDELYYTYNNREGNGQSQLLQDVKKSLLKTYSSSKIRGDGQVVVIQFTNDFIEVCPAFLEADGSYTYADSNNGGRWKKTDPSPEAASLKELDDQCNGNVVNLCRIVRAWKNKCGVKIGGLLIDTFVYNFFSANKEYADYGYADYDVLVKDFFAYLSELNDNRAYWFAPGSNQHVYKKKNSNFKSKAKKAVKNIENAISKNDEDTVYEIWRLVFGKVFPYPQVIKERSYNYVANEQYIEERYPMDISNMLRINCEVQQAGFRTELLRTVKFLRKNKKLKFFIESTDVEEPYNVLWKVKNEGWIAKQRNTLRGEILESNLSGNMRKESSDFEGGHFVECYIIKDGYCVARDRIDVPISNV
ncbi:nucleotidyltransferase domain-containing protein [Sphingobacterium sp. PCS056]|uniref:SMODS domain-containing nucleotidyltransferase n=1 Tax=Sphingobacterium sp. PCS056 TaxID=2931400 RepID=UPI00200F4AE6|nr:nucleotidyltransferase domain-containing protein [Sphingobacterium sp. PCS056]UPZ36517.1 nucleotidyltransferase domain-containing protein [Sphingobacterium sp. PCS056]